MVLILAGTLSVFPRFWKDIRVQPIFWLSSALALYILTRSFFSFQEFPSLTETRNPSWTDFLQAIPLLALPIGWWFYQAPKQVPSILAVAIAGLFFGIAYQGDLHAIIAGPAHNYPAWRFAFGYNPNYIGLTAAAATLAAAAWMLNPNASPWRFTLAPPTILLLLLLVFLTQSRSVWLGLALSTLALGSWMAISYRSVARQTRLIASGAGITLLLSAVLILWSLDLQRLAASRLTTDTAIIELLLSGQTTQAAETGGAVGWRIGMWLAGLEAFRARPWFGWGPGPSQIIPHAEFIERPLNHFHNIYLEFLVAFGLIGILITTACFLVLIVAAAQATRYRLWSPTMGGGLLAITVLTATALFFTIRFGQSEGRAYLRLLEAFYVLAALRVADYRRAKRNFARGGGQVR